jgi:rhodanese-related sulfurtransferase
VEGVLAGAVTPGAGPARPGGRERAARPVAVGSAPCGKLDQVSYAGDITPEEAWKILSDNPDAVLVDCRTDAEWKFVGLPDVSSLGREVVLIEWNSVDGKRNENFVDDLVAAGIEPGERPVIFLCRSGNRSIGAAEAATAAGIAPSYNVLDGFEGNLDEHRHRGGTGWRAIGLPWVQS